MAQKHFGIGKETVYGTPVAAATFLELLSEAIRREPQFIPVKSIRSVSPRAQSLGRVVTRGPFRAIANYQDIASILYYWFGDAVAPTGGGPYTHTLPAASPAMIRPSLTLEVQRDYDDGGETHKYHGCVLTELGLSVAVGELCEVSGAVVGEGEETTGSPTSPTYPTLDLIMPTECVVSVDGVAKNVERWSLDASWPADEPSKLGATILARKPKDADVMTVRGSFTLLAHDSAAVWTKFNTYGDADLLFVATGAAGDSLTINVNKVKILQATPGLDGRTPAKPEVTWEAYLDPALGSAFQAVVVNDKATLP